MTLNGMPFTVIGVTPPGFKGTLSLAGPDRVWVPLGMREQLTTGQLRTLITNRRFRWISMVGRMKPGVDFARRDAAMKTIASALEKQYPGRQRRADRSRLALRVRRGARDQRPRRSSCSPAA